MPDASSSSTIFSVSNAITAAYSFATSGSFISRAAHGPIPTRPCASGCLSDTAGWCHDTRKLVALRTRSVTPTISSMTRPEIRSSKKFRPKFFPRALRTMYAPVLDRLHMHQNEVGFRHL